MDVFVLLTRSITSPVGVGARLAIATRTKLLASPSPILFTAETLNRYVFPMTNLVSIVLSICGAKDDPSYEATGVKLF